MVKVMSLVIGSGLVSVAFVDTDSEICADVAELKIEGLPLVKALAELRTTMEPEQHAALVAALTQCLSVLE